jgi:hypothetical protein
VDLAKLNVGTVTNRSSSVLELILRFLFRMDNRDEVALVAKALERCKERVLYCFDSYSEVETVEWVHSLLVERRSCSWLHRYIIAVRPDCASISLLRGGSPIELRGFESATTQNMMVELIFSTVDDEFRTIDGDFDGGSEDFSEFLRAHPELATFARNPLLCDFLCFA